MDRPGLLERGDELGVLHECAAEVAAQGRGRVLLVSGEAGIGKTALLRQFRDELPRRVTRLWGTCDALFTPRPLGPLLEPVSELGGEPEALVARGAKPFDVAVALVESLRAIAPAVLIVEDMHLADEATLDVVRVLARQAGDAGLLLVLSYRSDEMHRDHRLRIVLGELPAGDAATRLELARLSRETVDELAAESGLDSGELYGRTAGNPFFVTETLAVGSALIPETVRDAVHARVARLSPPARALLDAVAIVPQRAEVWLLEALTDGALGALDECLRSGVLRAEADGVVFRHELARLAVEESLPPHQAVALHRRALAALADPALAAPDLARLAHHAEAAGDGPAVLRYAPEAGERASGQRRSARRARLRTTTGGRCGSRPGSNRRREPRCSSVSPTTRTCPTCAPRRWRRSTRRWPSIGGQDRFCARVRPSAAGCGCSPASAGRERPWTPRARRCACSSRRRPGSSSPGPTACSPGSQ